VAFHMWCIPGNIALKPTTIHSMGTCKTRYEDSEQFSAGMEKNESYVHSVLNMCSRVLLSKYSTGGKLLPVLLCIWGQTKQETF
jgi:hypothetical protein